MMQQQNNIQNAIPSLFRVIMIYSRGGFYKSSERMCTHCKTNMHLINYGEYVRMRVVVFCGVKACHAQRYPAQMCMTGSRANLFYGDAGVGDVAASLFALPPAGTGRSSEGLSLR